jgi:hypothetical protein
MRKQIVLDEFKLDRIGSYGARAKARLRLLDPKSGWLKGDLSLEASISSELEAKIRLMLEEEIARLVGDDVETASDGTVSEDF